jgi:hypothetical protein
MTLKEKFDEVFIENWLSDYAIECEQVAEDFAIEFADWIRVCKLKGRPYDFENTKELLEIYKYEKGL